jgi:peptide/nickel transport system substrate-binding protein
MMHNNAVSLNLRPQQLRLLLCLAGALLMLAGCGPAPAATTAPAATAAAVATVATQATTAPGSVQQPPAGQPKRGGSLVISWEVGDPPTLDPYLNTSFRSQEFAGFFYSRLLKFDTGPGIAANAFIPTGDLADKWDISKDGLTYTFHIRDNAKWQNLPPLNGRAVTADDVVYSFNRFMQVSPQKSNLAIVKEAKAVDAHNVAFTLSDVFAPFETTMALPLLWIVPKELVDADGDLSKRAVGTGPFLFNKYEKGSAVVGKRNPDYYQTGQPYVDEVQLLIIPDTSTTIAGMRSKSIDWTLVSQIDRKSLLGTNPDMVMTDYTYNLLGFGYFRLDAPPFNDIRVRQAVSMALDRDEAIKVLYEGRGTYDGILPPGLDSYYLDPLKPEFGPNAKYFKRDVAAAKKLLADAGFPNGLKVPMISTLNAYGATFNSSLELIVKQLKDAGIEATLTPQDYAAYISTTYLGKFDAGSMVFGLETPVQEPHLYFFNMYSPKGARNHGGVNDPALNDMIDKEQRTLDKADRKKQIDDIQRYLAEKMYYVPYTVNINTAAGQTWLKGYYPQSDYGYGGEWVPKAWLDGKPGN